MLSDGFEAPMSTLAELDEVVNEHFRVSQGLLERLVGRWSELKFVVGGCRCDRTKRERQVGVCVLLASGSWNRAGGGVVHGCGKLLQAMGLYLESVLVDVAVGQVTDRFGHGGEGRRRLDPSHGGGHGNGNELRFAVVHIRGEPGRA